MKKLIVSVVVLVILYFAARPYVAVSMDEWGFALRVRTSLSEKFSPDPLISFQR